MDLQYAHEKCMKSKVFPLKANFVGPSGALHGYKHEYFLTLDGVKSAFDEKTIFEFSLILEFSLTNDFISIHRYIFKPITDSYSIYLLT